MAEYLKTNSPPTCPVHRLVCKQTFSIEEMEKFLAQQDTYKICKDCAYFFEKEINRRINREILF